MDVAPERMTEESALRHEHVLRIREEVVLRRTEEAMAFADDLKAARGDDGATRCEILADRGEDELVLAVGAEFLRIGAGHHAVDDLLRRPGLDVLELVLGQVGIAVRVRRRFGLDRFLLRGERRVEKRIHRLFAVRPADRRVVGFHALSAAVELLVKGLLAPARGRGRPRPVALHRPCEHVEFVCHSGLGVGIRCRCRV